MLLKRPERLYTKHYQNIYDKLLKYALKINLFYAWKIIFDKKIVNRKKNRQIMEFINVFR